MMKTMMNPEVKEKWIAALEGDGYSQTSGNLHDAAGFCCLGVLADVQGCDWQPSRIMVPNYMPVIDGKLISDADHEFLSSEWSGLHRNTQKKLAKLNDDGQSFREIAAWIRKNVPTTAPLIEPAPVEAVVEQIKELELA